MKTIVQQRIEKAKQLLAAWDLRGLMAPDIDLYGLLAELEHLRGGIKDLAIAHGVQGASGPRQPTIEETSAHIASVMRDWMARANAFDAAVSATREHCEGVLRLAAQREQKYGKAGAHTAITEAQACKRVLDLLNAAGQSWLRPNKPPDAQDQPETEDGVG